MNESRKILLVEDDPDVAESLRGLLVRRGYTVRVAFDGNQAVNALLTDDRPDLMLLDLMMPNMDGFRLRALQLGEPAIADLPTIVITADTRVTAEQLKVNACFHKPFDVAKLLAAVDENAHRPS